MDFKNCELYRIKRKRDLFILLHIDESKLIYEINKYRVCINDKKRLLEKPSEELKKIQRIMLNKLYQLNFPEYVFSGVKGRSAFGNAIYHINCKYMLKLDMSKFFPNTHRNKLYEFFKDKLKMSPDVASICTDIVTVNYNKENVVNELEIFTTYDFLCNNYPNLTDSQRMSELFQLKGHLTGYSEFISNLNQIEQAFI